MATTTEPAAARRWLRLGARTRIVGWCVLLLALAVGALVLLLRQALLDRLEEEVAAGLHQEVSEVRELADGRNPETGQPFAGDVRAIFQTFLRRNIPHEGEALFTFVDGAAFEASRGAPHALDTEPELVERWAALSDTESGTVDTPAGPARFLAVPIRQDGGTLGVFVVTNFIQGERDEVHSVIGTASVTSALVLLIASALAWLIGGRVLAPVRVLTETARSITETDLSRRIPVQGDDEIAELTTTFNAMLERLEAAFGTQRTFVDDAAHELRTPITIIRGHLELLGDDPAERAEVIAIVTDELDRMNRLVDDMLLLAKSERPGFLDREPVPLAPLTRDWLQRAQALGERTWKLDGAAETVILADRQRLTQAVMNLAENAVRHTGPGDLVAIGTGLVHGEARMWVRDTGPGIDPADRDRIFERFAQASGAARSGGAGLGLAIVRAIADAHGGRVLVDSAPGHGACLTITIPATTDGRPEQWRAS